MAHRRSRVGFLPFTRAGCFAALALLLVERPLVAVDFVRGDVNGDGVVSLSDVYRLAAYMKFTLPDPIPCLSAADFDQSGSVNFADVSMLFGYLFLGYPPPGAPFPDPGPDPVQSGADADPPPAGCEAYGGGAPLKDPAAALEILDAVAPAGSQGFATLTVTLSNSTPIAGYSGSFRIAGGVLNRWGASKDLTGQAAAGMTTAGRRMGQEDEVQFVSLAQYISSDDVPNWFPPGVAVRALQIGIELKEGTPAGDYPISLLSGELADWASGQAIQPSLKAGVLRVLEAVPSWPIEASFRLGTGVAAPGEEVVIPFTIRANVQISAYSFSVDFDEEVLEALAIEEVWKEPSGLDFLFHGYWMNNKNLEPGNGGVDEGYLAGVAVTTDDGRQELFMPADTDILALRFRFRVRPGAQAKVTELRFLSGGKGPGQATSNVLTLYDHRGDGIGQAPLTLDSFVLLSGFVTVLDDVTIFMRGDANGDGAVDISDAQTSLDYLFLDGRTPACLDAADFNDDGLLDLADPVSTLQFLFLGGASPPPPYPEPGMDPTQDSMGCLYRR
jgi:hypothetical protein